MKIKIDDNVPMPKGRNKYPLGEMTVGQSFFVPGVTAPNISGSFGIHRPKRFSVRAVEENGVEGIRVWRIA